MFSLFYYYLIITRKNGTSVTASSTFKTAFMNGIFGTI